MPILKDEAQVLRVHDAGNTSQVLVLLGRRFGQIRVHAKGARRWSKRGFAGGFDPLARGEFLVYPRGGERLWVLKEWDERFRPRGLGASSATFYAALFLCELAEALTRETAGSAFGGSLAGEGAPPALAAAGLPAAEGEGAPLYDALARAAAALDARAAPAAVVLRFALEALETAGLLPGFDCCASCGQDLTRAVPARLDHAGLHCARCTERAVPAAAGTASAASPEAQPEPLAARTVPVTPEVLAALRFLRRTGKPAQLGAGAAQLTGRLLAALVRNALEHDLRTLPVAARLMRGLARRRAPVAPAPAKR